MLTKTYAIAGGPFLHYIGKVPDKALTASLKVNRKALHKLLSNIPHKKRTHAYAAGKWTIKESVQHLIDAERVFAYRALRTARMDATPMPGFDENNWAAAANNTSRKWNDLVGELMTVRTSTEMLFSYLGDEELLFAGMASGQPINALALGYVIAGHAQHHIDIIRERYL